MKTAKYQKRFYREFVCPGKLYRQNIVVRETDLDILCDKPVDADFVRRRIEAYRRQIDIYICKDERFLASLKPVEVETVAPAIVKKMAQAAKSANVGPMAAVAGAIAQFLGRDLLRRGAKTVIIENGGDIFLRSPKPVKIGIYAGRSRLSGRLALKIIPGRGSLGICASSGTVGHSLSFGNADCAIILAKNAALADAAVTAVANLVRERSDLARAIKFARSIKGVRGAVIIIKNSIASWGQVQFSRDPGR